MTTNNFPVILAGGRSNSRVDVLLGEQWGDEGKGKVIDVISPNYDVIARFQGGPNAGHTLVFNHPVFGRVKIILHQVCSGIFEGKTSISGAGMVIDPRRYLEEVAEIMKYRSDASGLIKIARGAHIILPIHLMLDRVNELAAGKSMIGSTLRGIGPCYEDRTARRGLTFDHALDPSKRDKFFALQKRLKPLIEAFLVDCKDDKVRTTIEEELRSMDGQLEELLALTRTLSETVEMVNGQSFMLDVLSKGQSVLAEGAQGALLDVVYGTYPFVTSSVTTPPGAALGLEISWREIRDVIGVFKAYSTRVGQGPFPTEYHPGLNGYYIESHGRAHSIQRIGGEFGSSTGRPRRCGRLDLPALRYAVYVTGANKLVMTMIDVFNAFESVEVCTGYTDPSVDVFRRMHEAIPIFQELPWGCSVLPEMKTLSDLPQPVLDYIAMIEAYVGVPIEMVSTGPDRERMVTKVRIGAQVAPV